ncbi:hypothetical protein CKALI_11235 [Corynebacterium kalinowskii]|uniref:Uncharacterized protein n=1 Tax=Corynebacterium kalinowskii TaxID=2675216 RepID=A0A6B8VT54_9CORY|nr:hypothetical protein [Corynebacterium kalinowskii]QGU03091.1 hypothetical protein CKALI_11235 [Corynebacterium kalinowskii]
MEEHAVRIISITIAPNAVIDDGENLTQMDVRPITITARDWDAFTAGGIAGIKRQLEAAIAQASQS